MSIGNRISELRSRQNLSQEDLARELGISRQAVSKWERDLSSPDTLNLIKLSQILNADLEYLAMGRMLEKAPPQIVINLLDRSSCDPSPLPQPFVHRTLAQQPRQRNHRKVRLNPIFWIGFAGLWFVIGFLIGVCF